MRTFVKNSGIIAAFKWKPNPINIPSSHEILGAAGRRLAALGEHMNRAAEKRAFIVRYPKEVIWLRNLEPLSQHQDQRWSVIEERKKRLAVVATSYQQPKALIAFLSSMECQTSQDFVVQIYHDGEHATTQNTLERYMDQSSLDLTWFFQQFDIMTGATRCEVELSPQSPAISSFSRMQIIITSPDSSNIPLTSSTTTI